MFASLGQGLFTGSGLVSVLFSPVYFGVRRAHKGACNQTRVALAQWYVLPPSLTSCGVGLRVWFV